MFETPHASVALWLATRISNPWLAFILSIISHFILDIIPHGDEVIGEHIKDKREKFIYLLKMVVADMLLASALVIYFLERKPEVDRLVLSLAVLGAWLPDILWLSVETFKIKFLYFYIRLHNRIHHLISWQYSPVYGVPFQIIFTLAVIKATF